MNRFTKSLMLGPFIMSPLTGATNFVPGVSETIELAGPFAHAGGIGDTDNASTSATFVGGFNASSVAVSATLDNTGGSSATYASEAGINFTQPDSTVLGAFRIDGSLTETYTLPFQTSNISSLGSVVDPAGTWSLEMIESFDDVAGPDQFSSGLSITFSSAGVDASIEESMGILGAGASDSSVGELGLAALIDTYTFTLDTAGLFTVTTSADTSGLVGVDADTELGLFDAAGVLLSFNDDIITGNTFSEISADLPAGDYTIAVGSFDTNFEDLTIGTSVIGDVVGGAGLGDYSIDFSLVPEPSTGMLAFIASLGLLRRRRS